LSGIQSGLISGLQAQGGGGIEGAQRDFEEAVAETRESIKAEIEALQALEAPDLSKFLTGLQGAAAKQKATERFESKEDLIQELTDKLEAVENFVAYRQPITVPVVITPDVAGGTPSTGGAPSTGGGSLKTETADLLNELKISKALTSIQKLLADTVTPADELGLAFDALNLVSANLSEDMGITEEELGKVRSMLNGMKDDLDEGALNDQFSGLKSVVEGTVEPFEKLQDQLNALQALIDAGDAAVLSYLFGTNDPEAIAEVMGRITGQIKELREKGEEAAETFSQTMAPAIASLAHTFTNDFVNSLLSGRDALESFKNFAKNIVSQIIATFLQMAVVNQILNAVFSSIPGFQAQPTMSFGGGGGAGSGRSFAGGGALQGRTPYLVGERGPELFVPNTSGTIKTNADTKNKMGGDTFIVNQSLNFSTGVVPTVRAEIQKMLPQISDVTKNAVLESTRRGGTYRRGLLGA
jgi:hypothetical protein